LSKSNAIHMLSGLGPHSAAPGRDGAVQGGQSDDRAALSPFAQLDEVLLTAASHGVVRIRVDADGFGPLARHVGRRARQVARRVISAAGVALSDPWRHVTRQLGIAPRAELSQPADVAAAIAEASAGAVIVLANDPVTGWGEAIATDLVRYARQHERELLLVLLDRRAADDEGPSYADAVIAAPVADEPSGNGVDLELTLERLGEDDGARWWDAVVHQDALAKPSRFGSLGSLDRWWEATRHRPVDAPPQAPAISDAAARLLTFVVHARQTLAAATIEALDLGEPRGNLDPKRDVDPRRELVELGLATTDAAGGLTALDDQAAGNLNATDKRHLAEVLADSPTADAWSVMRAAELHGELCDASDAERLAFEALSRATDGVARDDLWQRWDAIIDSLSAPPKRKRRRRKDPTDRVGDDSRLPRILRSTDHALALGDSDRAFGMAREAMALAAADGNEERFDVLLLHGRASYARGDTTTAALSLGRALNIAQSAAERARAAALMAQVRYMAGDPEQAQRHADDAIEHGEEIETRLDGRNVAGKLLLAKEDWAAAEQHFATDAYEATRAGNAEYELRARLNRAIAVLYLGRREQAREMLEEIMDDGERRGIHRAVAYTLSNLATIALLQHEYERALTLLEKAIEVRRRYETRVGLVLPISNLAELRLRLGLIAEAEHSLRFGLQACGQGLPMSRYAYFAKVAACIHLERGETGAAYKEIQTAITGATCGGDVSALARCHRIAARIALEDGDVTRARAAVERAAEQRHTPSGKAELAILRGLCARAAGEPFLELAREALALAQRADDPESLREAHQLLFQGFMVAGDDEAARSHLRCAIQIRDRVAAALRPALRQRFLNRRSLSDLRDLELGLDADEMPPTLRSDSGRPRYSVDGTARESDAAAESSERRRLDVRPKKDRLLVGESPAIRALRGTIRRVAPTNATVLVTGQTGSGKELVAEAIHRASDRTDGPLVKVNCAALVETLLLSELFGHEKGAFTGASARRRGRFEVAEGGTLFLDEIGDISPRTQVALLRVLQESTFERVGGTTQLHANVRIVCATHRDLRAMVERGEFREDLYYRLCGVQIEVAPLKDRIADLPLLSEALLEQAAQEHGIERKTLSAQALQALSRHDWPGNVRELENALRVAALFAKNDDISLSDVTDNVESLRYLADLPTNPGVSPNGEGSSPGTIPPPPLADGAPDSLPPPASSTEMVYAEIRGGTKLADMKRKLEQECIARALVETGGNITRAAKLLGMKRPRLSQLVKQYELGSVLEDIKS
jgi:DNA-binding NtrC family response regulator/tetratricopeptide (TPR) repeat protein